MKKQKTEVKLTTTRMVEESEATGKVKEVYDEIKESLGIDFIPNMYKAMATNPLYLESTWKRIQAVMSTQGMLSSQTKDIIAYVVSVVSGANYCIGVYTEALKHGGLDDKGIMEILAVIDVYKGLNQLNIGLQTQPDEKPWHGCGSQKK